MHVDIFSDGLVSCVPDMRRFVCNDDPIAFEMGLPPETASLMSSGSVQRQHHGSICSSGYNPVSNYFHSEFLLSKVLFYLLRFFVDAFHYCIRSRAITIRLHMSVEKRVVILYVVCAVHKMLPLELLISRDELRCLVAVFRGGTITCKNKHRSANINVASLAGLRSPM